MARRYHCWLVVLCYQTFQQYLQRHSIVSTPSGIINPSALHRNSSSGQPKALKTFDLPTYVLNGALLSSQRIHHKCKTRYKFGVYLVQYPSHNHDITLVLNHDSSLVIPQFHVRYDPLFTTTKYFDLPSLWKGIAGFGWQVGHTLSHADRASKRA